MRTTDTPCPRGFPTAEFEHRVARAQSLMANSGLTALLVTTEPDVRYFTGFLTRFWESPSRPWFLIVPVSGKPVAVIPSIGAELMGKTWIDNIHTWRAPDLTDDGVSLLADTLAGLAGHSERIGMPMGHGTQLRMPLADLNRVMDKLPGRELVDATDIIIALQTVKSEAEIRKIETACAIAGRAFDRVPEIARAGVPLDKVFRRFQMALLDEGADWVPYLAGGAGQGGYGDVISPASEAPLRDGDVLMLDTGAVFDGYFCDYDRNWAVGNADDATRNAHDILYEATSAGFSAARPGATASDLYHAMHKVISRAGDAGDAGRLGHGLGMRLTEWPSLIASDTTELVPGMVLTLEPGLEIAPGRIMVHEENIVITGEGARWLTTRTPQSLPRLD